MHTFLHGYTVVPQVEIAKRHLLPEALRQSGITSGEVALGDGVLERLIGRYCRESGVRNLQKQLDRILRKSARQLVESGGTEPIQVPLPAPLPIGRYL